MTTPNNGTLDKVRKLLAKAEAEGCTLQEAEALTAKAAELMAKYGIDRALLAATKPETDRPSNRKIDIDDPWSRLKATLLQNLATPLRCESVRLTGSRTRGQRVHVFGFESDLERLDVMYTSLLLQMFNGLRHADVPSWVSGRQLMAWRRSWMLGFISAVRKRVMEAERRVQAEAEDTTAPGTALVLADRSLVVQHQFQEAYKDLRNTKLTYSGSGYRDGYATGQRADIGRTGVGRQAAGALR